MVAILYGSTTGKTEAVADLLQTYFPDSRVFGIADTEPAALAPYDTVLLGTSTWGTGALQDDWKKRLGDFPPEVFAGKVLGFFGLGDKAAFADTFCTGMVELHRRYSPAASRVIGTFSGKEPTAVGLALDDDNQALLTEGRVAGWAERLVEEGAIGPGAAVSARR